MVLLKLRLQYERNVVHARKRARDLAEMLGFDRQDQVRLATATSELARNAFRYAREGTVEFAVAAIVQGEPQHFEIRVCDAGPGIPHLDDVLGGSYRSTTGMGKGIVGTRRLMDRFHIDSKADGTTVTVSKALPKGRLPVREAEVRAMASKLALADVDPFQEVERQNQELLRTLADLREKQEQLAQVNSELEDTNRGVVALYAELEQNATDLRRVSDLKTTFLSNLSHEFRTPLNSILALCQILSDRADGDLNGEQEKQVGYIRRSAADLSEMVNDLLDLAKVEAGKVDIRPRSFTVVDLFGALRGMLRTLLTSTQVELVFRGAEGLEPLFTDEQKVSQILRNLISNALKFTERGSVTVTAEAAGETVVFRVADTGIGIAPEDRERIFDEFVQVAGEIQNRVRGTGLGLPLSRTLAGLLGGSLVLEDSSAGGSVFRVDLPMRFADAGEDLPVVVPVLSGKPVVLVIEDNLETRFIHEAALRATGYTLQFARNLAEARRLTATQPPTAVVLDRMLDGVDSLGYIAELRGEGFHGPVIAVSVVRDEAAALDAGADAFLTKPIEPGLLAETLERLLKPKAAQDVLLVDDDEINRYVLREALGPFGFRIAEARSGREALQLAAKRTFAVVFLDVAMPGMTGLETLRELRSAGSTVPVVVHTSKDLSPEELRFLRGAGAHLFSKQALNGPRASEELRAVLREVGAQ